MPPDQTIWGFSMVYEAQPLVGWVARMYAEAPGSICVPSVVRRIDQRWAGTPSLV